MITQPSSEQLKALSTTERIGYRLADWCNRKIKTPLIWWNYSFMNALIWLCLGRRLRIHQLENIRTLGPDARIVMAANHRSFFDFFIVSWITYNKTNLPKRIFFPVRSRFFYDSLIGIPFTFLMGGFAMFPPIMRSPEKKPFNRYAVNRLCNELDTQGTLVGFHPEGTRNKGNDPYVFLPTRPGIGEVILRSQRAVSLSIFVIGVTNGFFTEMYRNWFKSKEFPIDVWLGSPRDFSTFRNQPGESNQYLTIANQTMQDIMSLAAQHRSFIGQS